MCVKDVYSIRLNKNDTLIREYLKQYPVSSQSSIIKDLIIQGIHARLNIIQDFESTNEKLEEVLTILRRSLEKSIVSGDNTSSIHK